MQSVKACMDSCTCQRHNRQFDKGVSRQKPAFPATECSYDVTAVTGLVHTQRLCAARAARRMQLSQNLLFVEVESCP